MKRHAESGDSFDMHSLFRREFWIVSLAGVDQLMRSPIDPQKHGLTAVVFSAQG